jgi:glycine dehydrogenase subunit 1
VAARAHANLNALLERLHRVPGVRRLFSAPIFHEAAIALPQPVAKVLARMRSRGILGGYDLSGDYPQLGNALLVCVTETKTQSDLEAYAAALAEAAGN